MNEVLFEFEINLQSFLNNNSGYLITDNAPNMIKLGKELNINRLYCIAHFLNKIIN